MIKKSCIFILILFALWCPVIYCSPDLENDIIYYPYYILSKDVILEEYQKIDIYDVRCKELLVKQKELALIEDRKEWFIEYKNLTKEYSLVDPSETIYDYYSEYELQLLFQVVEAEVTSGDFESKCNVASVIFNRLYNDGFGDTLSEILVKKQFSCISDGRYKNVEVTEDTILACEYVWTIGCINECLYFESGTNSIHSSYATFQFEDSVGHKFYSVEGN